MKKNKTVKTVSKRFLVTKTGKVIKRKCGQDHLNAKEPGSVTRFKRSDLCLNNVSAKVIKKILNN